jgi:glucose dehydrogenase
MKGLVVLSLLVVLHGCSGGPGPNSMHGNWEVYGGGPDSIRYSTLNQINRDNVDQLEVAWTYDTGDSFPVSEMQCNPIVVDGVLFGTSPKLRAFAINAATGEEIWSFDPHGGKDVTSKMRNRGVTYWADGADKRIFVAVHNWFYALNAATGEPVPGFGQDGRIDLTKNLGRDASGQSVGASTPGVIYKDMLIVGSIISEALPAGPGDIRAFDVRSGELRWKFHTIPHPGEFGHDTWPENAWQYIGGANNWPGLSIDIERGIVFAGTGSAAFDFYGSNRLGDNLFANTLLALNADTGERIWHFQLVKHDVWDRDFPAPPNLVTVEKDGQTINAVAQVTKSGWLLLFDRETGEPVYPIEYRDVPPSDVPGEVLAKTQPFVTKPAPFSRQEFTEEMVTNRTPEAHKVVLERLRSLRSGPQFTPPSREGSVVFPGFDGGGEWGGQAFDPETGYYYVNANEMPWVLRIVERGASGGGGGRQYNRNCGMCHKADLSGSPPEFPSLVNISKRLSKAQIMEVIEKGRGRMPGYAHLNEGIREAIVEYLFTGADVAVDAEESSSPIDQKYTHDGYNKFLDPDGYPAVEPPWGTLNAIDLNTGEYVWKIPFGEIPGLEYPGVEATGSENYGGPVVTAGGLLFIGATNHDRKFRVFDKLTGEKLWETTLPASGNATPAVYEVNGRQFIAIAAGGGKSGSPTGGKYVAFALPE